MWGLVQFNDRLWVNGGNMTDRPTFLHYIVAQNRSDWRGFGVTYVQQYN